MMFRDRLSGWYVRSQNTFMVNVFCPQDEDCTVGYRLPSRVDRLGDSRWRKYIRRLRLPLNERSIYSISINT